MLASITSLSEACLLSSNLLLGLISLWNNRQHNFEAEGSADLEEL